MNLQQAMSYTLSAQGTAFTGNVLPVIQLHVQPYRCYFNAKTIEALNP